MNEIILTRIKLISVLIISNIILFYKDAFYLNLIFFLFILFYVFIREKFFEYISWLKPLFIAVIIIFVIQLLTKESLIVSALSSLRILSLSSLIFLLIQTTKLSLIVKALNFLPPQLSFVLSLSLGMIPQLTKEIKQVTIAQQARGHKINWNILKSYLPILVPLFTKSFIRSEQISISMQARGFTF
ncbi:MAG: energy-coupling factor transporter transmembrane component T [Patescibacteria group bacterium]|jgi:energy-coupling factor transporter transmembrane protein EcfT